MLATLADSAAVAWPLALTFASVLAVDRVRATRRRRRLNGALHELRRPLQALVMARPAERPGEGQLELALAALGELDQALNGGAGESEEAIVDPHSLAADAVERWRAEAARRNRSLELRWRADGSRLIGRRTAIARALDNLIANSLEHGRGPIAIEGQVRDRRLRLFVVDGGSAKAPAMGAFPRGRSPALAGPARRFGNDPRRGHGLRLVAEVAAQHGGRFAACRHGNGACAVIELPLAPSAHR